MDTSKPPTPENRRVTSRVVQNLKGEDAEGAPAGVNPGWYQVKLNFKTLTAGKVHDLGVEGAGRSILLLCSIYMDESRGLSALK